MAVWLPYIERPDGRICTPAPGTSALSRRRPLLLLCGRYANSPGYRRSEGPVSCLQCVAAEDH